MSDKKLKITITANSNQAKPAVKDLKAEMDKLTDSAAKAQKVLEAQETLGVRPYKEIQAEITKLRTAYATLKTSGTQSSAELYQAKVKLKEKTAELRKETGDWAGELKKAKAGLVGLAAAGYAVIKSFKEYSEFSQRMGEVNTQLDVSKERFNALSDEIRGMSKEIPQTASELAAAEYEILSAGVALEKSTWALEKSAKAAVAGVTNTQTAANTGIAVINAYGKSIDDLDDIYDILFQTVKLGVMKFEDLAQGIGQVLPTANAADVSITDLMGSLASLTKAGMKTPIAITALRGAINALAAPADTAKEEFDRLGITWQGLIPTLDAIREKNLSIDQMRALIPDVEARTGVLALTQNFDMLVGTLNEMSGAAGSMEEAYEKMKDTPENQMKLFRNEINDLVISAGALVSKGLIPASKALRILIGALEDADPATKTLVGLFTAAVAATALWKMGLGSLVSALGGVIAHIKTAQVAVGTLNAQFAASGVAMKAGLAGSILYTSYQLATLTKEIYLAIKAHAAMEKAQDNLMTNTDRVMDQFADYKDFKLPADITSAAQADLAEFRTGLAKARAYYTALKNQLEEKAEETTWLGNATDEAKEAQKELKQVDARLTEIQEDFNKVGEAAKNAAGEMEKPADAVKATEEQLDAFEKAAKAAYEEAKKYAAEYAEKVIEWEEKVKYAKLSTEDKIRELSRKTMTDVQAWNDKKLQADEKYYAAKKALAEGDYELAEKLAGQAEDLYADLATEVKNTESGNDVVVKSLEDTTKVAKDGVRAVGSLVQDLYTQQRNAAEKAKNEWTATADGILKQLDEIAKQREANVKITLSGVAAAESKIADLCKSQTKFIYVKTVQVGSSSSSTYAGEETKGMSYGGKLAGYGGGDRVRALLEAGEFVIRKEAVRKYGAALFHGLNAMRLNVNDAMRARVGGLIANISMPEIPRFAAGGMVGMASGGEVMTLRLQAGNVDMPLKVMGSSRITRGMVKEFERELVKMGLSKR